MLIVLNFRNDTWIHIDEKLQFLGLNYVLSGKVVKGVGHGDVLWIEDFLSL